VRLDEISDVTNGKRIEFFDDAAAARSRHRR